MSVTNEWNYFCANTRRAMQGETQERQTLTLSNSRGNQSTHIILYFLATLSIHNFSAHRFFLFLVSSQPLVLQVLPVITVFSVVCTCVGSLQKWCAPLWRTAEYSTLPAKREYIFHSCRGLRTRGELPSWVSCLPGSVQRVLFKTDNLFFFSLPKPCPHQNLFLLFLNDGMD